MDEEKKQSISKVRAEAGRARAQALSADERKAIAKKAAEARWNAGLPKAVCTGFLNIAGFEIPCAVLDDGRRVVIQREVVGLLTGNKKGGLNRYFMARNLQPYVPDKFRNKSLDQASLVLDMKGRKAQGFEGDDLVDICKMYLNARKNDDLLKNQIHLAEQAEVIITAFAKVGINALIDEATGFQEIRDRKALQLLLDKYLNYEFAAWAKRFKDEFYKEIFRLRGWKWKGMSVNRPQVVAYYTLDLVYARLAPGLVDELKKRNPKDEKGRRKGKNFQLLTDDVGIPALADHLKIVTAFMRGFTSWKPFYAAFDRAFPKMNTTMYLPFPDDDLIDETTLKEMQQSL